MATEGRRILGATRRRRDDVLGERLAAGAVAWYWRHKYRVCFVLTLLVAFVLTAMSVTRRRALPRHQRLDGA